MRFPIAISDMWAPILTVLGMPRSKSFVELDSNAGTLRVRAGVWFDETFALADIEGAEASSWPWYGGLGVKLGPGNAVSVVGSMRGIVALKLRRPQSMRVIVPVRRSELRVSVDDPDAFLRALRESAPAASQRA